MEVLGDFEAALEICQENKEGLYRHGSSKQKCTEDASPLLNIFGKLGHEKADMPDVFFALVLTAQVSCKFP